MATQSVSQIPYYNRASAAFDASRLNAAAGQKVWVVNGPNKSGSFVLVPAVKEAA